MKEIYLNTTMLLKLLVMFMFVMVILIYTVTLSQLLKKVDRTELKANEAYEVSRKLEQKVQLLSTPSATPKITPKK